MLAILVVFVLTLLGAALGRRILLWSRIRFATLAEQLCFSAALGLGILALAIMAAGLLGQFRGHVPRLAAVILACILIPDVVLILSAIARKVRELGWPKLNPFERLLTIVILLAIAFSLVSALAPPTAWDATASHLTIPHLWLGRGRIDRIDDLHSSGPLNAVMLFIPAMLLAGDTAPALIHLAFTILAGVALYAAAHRCLSRSGALLAAAAFFLMPVTAALAPEAAVDFPLILFVLLAFIAFTHWWETERLSWLILAAVNLGLAAGTKYTGLHALVLLSAGILVRIVATRDRRPVLLSHGAAAILVAVLVGCPWYVRSAVLTGNPFYPVLAKVIPTRHISAALTGAAPAVEVPGKYPRDLANLLLFPVNYTFGFTLGIGHGPTAEGLVHSPGPLFLALVPLLFLLGPAPRWAWMALVTALGGLILIVPAFPLPRYVLPFLVPCGMIVGLVFERASARRSAHRLFAAMIVIILPLQLLPFAGRAAARARVVFGLESRDKYLLRSDDIYPMARRASAVLPADAKLLYVGERSYYFLAFGIDTAMGMPLRQGVVDFPALRTPGALLARIHELGYTHVIVNEAVLAARTPFALDMLRPLKDNGLREITREKKLVLYEVTPRPVSH